MDYDRTPFSLTPWVRRLLAATGAVYLLQLTVFTSPWLVDMFGFSPVRVLSRPWGLLTYAFLHGSFLHLLGNAIPLFFFGPPVERRMGGRAFIRLYVVAALGGPALSLMLVKLAGTATIIGASAAVFGVMLAFVMQWPDAPIFIFPLPVPVRAKWLVLALAALSLVAGISGAQDGVAHFAHLGGFAAAFLYVRAGSFLARAGSVEPRAREPALLVRPPSSEVSRRTRPFEGRRRRPDPEVRQEVDRVLDKISQDGMDSLTPDERHFLDEMSRKFKQDS